MSLPESPRVRAASCDPIPPGRTGPKELFLMVARFGMRVLRSIRFRFVRLLSLDWFRVFKRNRLFPLRNKLLQNKPLSLNAEGIEFVLAPLGGVPLEIWAGTYSEKHELELIVKTLQPGNTFIDVGANVGLFSIPAGKRVQRHGKVFAFEPTPATHALLRENAELNDVRNIHFHEGAAGEHAGEAVLQLNASGKDGLNTLGKPVHSDTEVVGRKTVPVTTLDTFIAAQNISSVDVMKVDVEGAELFVFRGAKKLLSRPDAPLILFEYSDLSAGFDYHPVESMWLLQGYGYSFFRIESTSGKISEVDKSPKCHVNLIAVKEPHPFFRPLRECAK